MPSPSSQSVGVGQHLVAPTNPTKSGFHFVGWTQDLTTEELFDFGATTLNSNIALYALWSPIGGSNGGEYYNSITATSGSAMYNQLNTLINVVTAGSSNNQNNSYEEVKTILQSADKSIIDPTKLWSIYDSSFREITWDHINNWNREHVWPQSLLGQNATSSGRNSASDPHNLRAITPSTNTSRSNKYFDLTTAAATYYPGDGHRGDVARILLYMAVRYNNLSLVDGTPNTYQMSKISVLLTWHQQDPVDQFEIQRNNVIYNWQGNRNPFIDNPNYFEPIWNYLMEQDGLQVQALERFNNTISAYELNKMIYVPIEVKVKNYI